MTNKLVNFFNHRMGHSHEIIDCLYAERCHLKRYEMATLAIKWLDSNKKLLRSKLAREMIQSNKEKFFRPDAILQAIQKFDTILKDYLEKIDQ